VLHVRVCFEGVFACVLRVSSRIRDAGAGVTVVLRIVVVVSGRIGARVGSWSFSVVRLSWQPGGRWTPGMVLYLSPVRFRLELDVVFGVPTVSESNIAATECRVSTEADECFGLHDRAIDTPTLSPECQQPSHQSVKNPPPRRYRP
jgi:hypothetical protein